MASLCLLALRRTPVSVLLCTCRPPDIARLIVPVVVDAVYRMLGRRAVAYVGIEVLKRTPTLADGNASPSVVLISSLLRIFAAAMHTGPGIVLRAVTTSMGTGTIGSSILTEATTGARDATPELSSIERRNVSAVAATQPDPHALGGTVPFGPVSIGFGDSRKASEALTGDKRIMYSSVVHDLPSYGRKWAWGRALMALVPTLNFITVGA
jgi:hypothetical protein